MLENAGSELPTYTVGLCMLENFDPVFGIFYGASEMILEGMRDMILTLEGPQLQYASFRITLSQAELELVDMPHAEVFQRLASCLHAHLL